VRSFLLANKKGAEHWIEPIVDGLEFSTAVRRSSEKPPQGTISKNDHCLLTKSPLPRAYIREQGKSEGLGQRMMAIVVEGKTRQFVSPNSSHESTANVPTPDSIPDASIDGDNRYQTPVIYGMNEYSKLFTSRQLIALSTFSSLLSQVRSEVLHEASTVNDGRDVEHYADAVVTFLAFALDKGVDYWSTLATWASGGFIRGTFARQALSMSWDFAECNPFSDSTGNWLGAIHWVTLAMDNLFAPAFPGIASQCSATDFDDIPDRFVLSTDPPYYDNVPYSDLSDYFYIWLRHGIGSSYPNLLNTLLTPKQDELVADAHRQGGADNARQFFENGMAATFQQMNQQTAHQFPATVFYAFKQSERDEVSGSETSTGWETFLQGVIEAKWCVTGTWPVRTERSVRTRGIGSNALASSIVLVCRPRPADASMVTRRDFANALRKELPEAIKHLQSGNVAPVDLAQASIGPGMAVFSRYSKVVNADGSPMSVREALQLINQVLDESLVEQESDFDAETRFALRWFEQYGMTEGPFGDAETLAKAMAVSVTGVVEAGIAKSGVGKVRILKREELEPTWDPATDDRLTMWEVAQYLIRALEEGGETAAGELLQRIGNSNGEIARDLAYRLYQTCEKKSLAAEARSYNALVVSWPEINKLSRQQNKAPSESQDRLFAE
ncbi:hypothetical protein OAE37_03825, partial [Pirellulaceae bacterium]|nr:hypothetical protein [Pirellulaceae bacterium]